MWGKGTGGPFLQKGPPPFPLTPILPQRTSIFIDSCIRFTRDGEEESSLDCESEKKAKRGDGYVSRSYFLCKKYPLFSGLGNGGKSVGDSPFFRNVSSFPNRFILLKHERKDVVDAVHGGGR